MFARAAVPNSPAPKIRSPRIYKVPYILPSSVYSNPFVFTLFTKTTGWGVANALSSSSFTLTPGPFCLLLSAFYFLPFFVLFGFQIPVHDSRLLILLSGTHNAVSRAPARLHWRALLRRHNHVFGNWC